MLKTRNVILFDSWPPLFKWTWNVIIDRTPPPHCAPRDFMFQISILRSVIWKEVGPYWAYCSHCSRLPNYSCPFTPCCPYVYLYLRINRPWNTRSSKSVRISFRPWIIRKLSKFLCFLAGGNFLTRNILIFGIVPDHIPNLNLK